MKHHYAAALALITTTASFGQECANGRYSTANLFPDVTVTSAVVFGSNTGVSGSNQILRMDVYEPSGDALALRPVVICAFGGSFVGGARADVAPAATGLRPVWPPIYAMPCDALPARPGELQPRAGGGRALGFAPHRQEATQSA